MKRISTLALIAAATIAMAIPSTAAANTGDGSGGAPFTISNQYFVAYSCTHHSAYGYNGGGHRSQCSNGIYIRYSGERRYGTKCVVYPNNGGPTWYDGRC